MWNLFHIIVVSRDVMMFPTIVAQLFVACFLSSSEHFDFMSSLIVIRGILLAVIVLSNCPVVSKAFHECFVLGLCFDSSPSC